MADWQVTGDCSLDNRLDAAMVSINESEALCRRMIPFLMAKELAYVRDSLEGDAAMHLHGCKRCQALIDKWELATHPPRPQLLISALNRAGASAQQSIERHLEACSTCRSMLKVGPLPRLLSAVREGRRALKTAIETLEAFPSGTCVLPSYSLRYAGPDELLQPFQALTENRWFSLRLRQDEDQLAVAVLVDQPGTKYRAVEIEVFSGGHRLADIVRLEQVGAIWTGGAAIQGFGGLLAPNAELRYEATPLEESDYKEWA